MIALDTLLLVHAHRRDTSLHKEAARCVKDLAESGSQWAICYESLIEFYETVTQPKLWRIPSPPEKAWAQIYAWKEAPQLHLLADSDVSLEYLEQLSSQSRVQGPAIKEARIASCCLSHGVSELWTLGRDFSRFPDLKTRNPLV